ncbi:MAG: GntR family transcriptional regulator [Candidatus Acidiferrum sp.]
MAGRIAPGAKIIENLWARRFGVATSSVREALNILLAEGFVTKGHGRSARVLKLSKQDIVHLYEVRSALEGLAARLVTERRVPVDDLDPMIVEMQLGVDANDLRQVIASSQRFHLALLEKTGNPYLLEEGQRLIKPLYDFTLMRALSQNLDGGPWRPNVLRHRCILEAIRSGQPYFAEQITIQMISQFLEAALHVWADQLSDAPQKQSKQRKA